MTKSCYDLTQSWKKRIPGASAATSSTLDVAHEESVCAYQRKKLAEVTIKLKIFNTMTTENRGCMTDLCRSKTLYTMIVPEAATALEVASSPRDEENRHI